MKLDRLLSRIRAALQDYASEFEQRALAAEYADWCAKASARLEQVVPLIQAGQDFPALQIAESPPPVLDLVRQLSFADAEKWRSFCRIRGLPSPQPFDERSVDLVNQLYGKKISETHPLYREYRQAIRTRHEQQALQVLQSIRRVNPDDANAHAEFARLSHKLYQRHCTELVNALDQNDSPRILGLMDTIETGNAPSRDQDPTWQRALRFREEHSLNSARARGAELVSQLRQIRATGQWKDALPILIEWDVLRSQFNFTLSLDEEETATSARKWASGLLAEHKSEDERLRNWQRLSTRLVELSSERPSKKTLKGLTAELAELNEEREIVLAAAADSVNGSKPPPQLLQQLEQQTTLLQKHVRQRWLVFAGLAGSVVVVLAILWSIAAWSRTRNEHFQTNIASIRQHLQDNSTNALSDSLKEYDAYYASLSSDPAVASLISQARDYLNTHLAARDHFNKSLTDLTRAASKATPEQIPTLLTSLSELTKQINQLSVDDSPAAQSAAEALRVRLTQSLNQVQDAQLAKLTNIDNRAEKFVSENLTSGLSADNATSLITEAQKILAEALALPSSADTTAAQSVRAKIDTLAKKLESQNAAAQVVLANRALLTQDHSLDDYRIPLEALSTNPLTTDPTVAAAHALISKNPDWSGVLQQIFLPKDPETWAFLKQTDGRLQPATGNTSEDIPFGRLINNDVLGNTYLAEQVTYVDGKETKRVPLLLAGPPLGEPNRWGEGEELAQSARKIMPDGTLTNLSIRWVHFTGQNPKGDKFDNVHITPESKLVARVKQAFDPFNRSIREPLLRVLDDIRTDTVSSPILKAYLVQELIKIMQNRPREWGLTFSPSLQKDELDLAKITGGNLLPADWLFPANTHLAADLQAFFQRTAAVQYYPEASANLQSLLKKHTATLTFAGYVDLSQNPVLATTNLVQKTLWGLDTSGNWRPLFDLDQAGHSKAVENSVPARLTPLVVVEENSPGGT